MLTYLKNNKSLFHKIFCTYYMLLMAVAWSCSDDSAVCYVYFVDDMISRNGDSGPESKMTLCLVDFAKWWHWGRSCCVRLQACVFCYSSVLWTKYGLLKADTALFFVNSAGALMSINYVIIFYIFTTSRVRIVMVYAIFVCYFLIIYHYS